MLELILKHRLDLGLRSEQLLPLLEETFHLIAHALEAGEPLEQHAHSYHIFSRPLRAVNLCGQHGYDLLLKV